MRLELPEDHAKTLKLSVGMVAQATSGSKFESTESGVMAWTEAIVEGKAKADACTLLKSSTSLYSVPSIGNQLSPIYILQVMLLNPRVQISQGMTALNRVNARHRLIPVADPVSSKVPYLR